MRALLAHGGGRLTLEERPRPEAGLGQVIVRVRAAGICGSDVSIYYGTNPVATFPRTPGHEFAGEVLAVGEGVTHLSPGDHVTVDPVANCEVCRICRKGRGNVCPHMEVIGVHQDGGYQEEICVAGRNTYRISPAIPWEQAAIVEPFAVAAQVADRGGVQAGDTVVLLGAGAIAMTILQVCKLLGACCIVTDVVESRLKRAEELGADLTVNTTREDLRAAILQETAGVGADVAIDAACVGVTLEQAVSSVRSAGVVVTMGFSDRLVPATEFAVTKHELDIRGSRLNYGKFPQVIRWFEEGQLNPAALITHRLPFARAEEGFHLVKNQPESTLKVILTFD